MEEEKEIEYWESNADSWTTLSRLGYDICRDHINNPVFFEHLPEVSGKHGLDIGCGEGHNTRLVAKLGATIVGVDPSQKFIDHAKSHPDNESLEIQFELGKASQLKFQDKNFDFVISTMCLMDVPEIEGVFKEVHRVLKPGGFLQFSIVHPCFSPPDASWQMNGDNSRELLQVGGYFKEGPTLDSWSFTTVPEDLKKEHEKFKVVHYHRTLSHWINALIESGFILEKVMEPSASERAVETYPSLSRLSEVSWFIHFRARRG